MPDDRPEPDQADPHRLERLIRRFNEALDLCRSQGVELSWDLPVSELLAHLQLSVAYVGAVRDGTAHVCGIFPSSIRSDKPQSFALSDSLTGWMLSKGNTVGMTSLQQNSELSHIPHVRASGVRAYAGTSFPIEGATGFLSINGFDDRAPFTESELAMVALLGTFMQCALRERLTALALDPSVNGARAMSYHADVERALAHDEFVLHYQPYWSVHGKRVVGAEALLRWMRPEGLILPDEFIPFAERTGTIRDIDAWVLRKALSWAQSVPKSLWIGVNISAMEIDQSLPGRLEEALRVARVDPRRLVLEITESAAVSTSHDVIHVLKACRDQGVRIAIDDFGTGYASLAYLKYFPVDIIKLDQRFVAGLPHDTYDAGIAAAVIEMASRFGAQVIAEGVETVEQLAWLTNAQCPMVQGFLIAEPMEAEKFGDLMIGNHESSRAG